MFPAAISMYNRMEFYIIKRFIRDETVQIKPAQEAYKFFSNHFELSFPEFEFWYLRFENGLNCLDPLNRIVPSIQTLMDLPEDLLRNLEPYLAYTDQVNLGKVNHALRDEVKRWKPAVKNLEVQFDNGSSLLVLDGIKVQYENVDHNGIDACAIHREDEERKSIVFINADQMDVAFRDIETIHRNPKAKLEKFEIFVTTGFEPKIIEKLGSLAPQIETKLLNLTMHCSTGQDAILSSFQAGFLETIIFNDLNCTFNRRRDNCESHINVIAQLDQCRRAKQITIFTHSLHPAHFQLEHLTGLEVLDVRFRKENFTMSIATIVKWMRILQLETTALPLLKVEASCDFQMEDFAEHMENSTGLAVQRDGNFCRLNVSSARDNEYLELIFQESVPHNFLKITRKFFENV